MTRRARFSYALDFLFYARDDSDILTAENLKQFCEIESWVTEHPSYQHVCVLNAAGNCTKSSVSLARTSCRASLLTLLSRGVVDCVDPGALA